MSFDKVLIVEDSQALQRGYCLLLGRYRNKGLEILQALNGRDALGLLERNQDCDLIILDINMPKMSGFEFLETSMRGMGARKIPTIVISSARSEDMVDRALEAGADAYLTKPFNTDELHKLIKKLTGSRSSLPQQEDR